MVLKKILIGFSLIFAITLSSCGEEEEAERPKLDFDYTCEAEISVNDEVFKTEIEKSGAGFSFTFLYPAELEGMVVEIENENYKVVFQGLEQVSEREAVPEGAVCDFTASSLDYITHGKGITFTNDGEVTKGVGVFDGGDFSVIYNKKSYPDKISIGSEIEIDFSNFKKA